MPEGFWIPFLTILLAELGDKSQISVMLMATKTKRHLALLFGVLTAFLIVDGLAIFLGSYITNYIPQVYFKLVTAAVFIFFGIKSLTEKAEDDKVAVSGGKSPFLMGFSAIMLAEWGDKTQIASAIFAADFNPLIVIAAVMSALAVLSAAAIFVGRILVKKIKRSLLSKIAGLLFISLGFWFLIF